MEHHPTNKKLQSIKREMKTRKYWAIRKPHDRNPRSLGYYETEHVLIKEGPSLNWELEHQWSTSISDLLKIMIESYIQQETLTWSNNLTALRKNYMDLV